MHDNDSLKNYSDARKSGLKEYSKNVSMGQTGYLPFLEGILKNVEIFSEVDLGIVEVPLKKIKGTHSQMRSKSFAGNFMPLMDENTEFANKWKTVSTAHTKEGLRDPLKVYEYMNWFYIVEGNKRVSVLKYFDAFSYQARVTRLIPKKDEKDPNIRLYYEFLNFYKKTGINNIWFSKENSFNELLKYLENYENADDSLGWNKYKYFAGSIYMLFRKSYLEIGGGSLPITTGDALLEYIKLYGLNEDVYRDNLQQNLKKFLSELKYFNDCEAIEVKTVPEDMQENVIMSTISTIIKPRRKKLKVAFAFASTVGESNWTYSHEMGRAHVEKVLKGQVATSFIENVPENLNAYEDINNLAQKGYEVIFATSPAFINATLKTALENPNAKFLNCSYDHSFKNVHTYFGRIHEPRFLLGIIAGVKTGTNIIGYIGTFPIPEVISGINSFAIGVRMVNPRAKVKVLWTGKWDCRKSSVEASINLAQQGADIISHHNGLADKRVDEEYGLYTMSFCEEANEYKKRETIAALVWNWGIFYERILKGILSGSWLNLSELFGAETKPINFWWGIDSGILDIFYSKRLVPVETQKLVEFMKNMIMSDNFNPFSGPVYDRDGNLVIEEGNFASREQILSMDWFVEGVEGELTNDTSIYEFSDLSTGKI